MPNKSDGDYLSVWLPHPGTLQCQPVSTLRANLGALTHVLVVAATIALASVSNGQVASERGEDLLSSRCVIKILLPS